MQRIHIAPLSKLTIRSGVKLQAFGPDPTKMRCRWNPSLNFILYENQYNYMYQYIVLIVINVSYYLIFITFLLTTWLINNVNKSRSSVK